jgi:hypothetical protein
MSSFIVFGIGLGLGSYALCVLADPGRDAKIVRAFDKLTTRQIVKQDVTTYMDKEMDYIRLKEMDYIRLKRLFIMHKMEIYRNDSQYVKEGMIGMIDILIKLNCSPFFNDLYRPEYNILWSMINQNKSEERCDKYIKQFPQIAKDLCKNKKTMSLKEVLDSFEIKLIND